MPREKSAATPILDGYGGFHAEKSLEGVGMAMFAFHYHSRCELVLVTKGHSEIMTYDRRIEMDGAFVVCYPSGMLHMQKNDAALPYERYFVQFPVGILDDLPGQKEYSELISEFFVLNVDNETLRMITPWFAALAGSSGNRDDILIENRRRFLIGLILNELSPFIRSARSVQLTDRTHLFGSRHRQVFDVCRYIEDHFSENLTLERLSQEFFVSRSTLVRNFRQILDTTVVDYITTVRINRAKRLLACGFSIGDAAMSCGFSCASYFIRVFKRSTGMTPIEFLAKNHPMNQ